MSETSAEAVEGLAACLEARGFEAEARTMRALDVEASEARMQANRMHNMARDRKNERDALAVEVARLRKALKKIAGNGDATGCNPQNMADEAIAALTTPPRAIPLADAPTPRRDQ